MKNLRVGIRVRTERDEKLRPAKGSWLTYRHRVGSIVNINVDKDRPHLTEYGVSFSKSKSTEAWFKEWELTPIGRAKVPPIPPT